MVAGLFCIPLILLISILFSSINFNAYHMGDRPSIYQALASFAYILLWFAYGLSMGFRKQPAFLKLTTLYWGIGVLLIIPGYFVNLDAIAIPALSVFAGPAYGINHFLGLPSNIILAVICIVLPYGLSMIGYWIGREISNKSITKETEIKD